MSAPIFVDSNTEPAQVIEMQTTAFSWQTCSSMDAAPPLADDGGAGE